MICRDFINKVMGPGGFIAAALALLSLAPARAAGAGAIHFDFETGDLQGWRVMSGEFGQLITDRARYHLVDEPYNKQGTFYLSTVERPDHTPTDVYVGVIDSPVFVLEGGEMSLLVGGGKRPETYVALCTLDGKEWRKAQGNDQEPMVRVTWQAPDLIGQAVFVRVVDQATGGWSHVTFDDFNAQGHIDDAQTAKHWADYELQEKIRKVREGINAGQIDAAQRAVAALREQFGERYPDGARFAQTLDQLKNEWATLSTGGVQPDPAQLDALIDLARRFEAARREALVANPLLTAQPLVFVTRQQYAPDHHPTETMFQTGEANTASFAGGGALKVLDFARGAAVRTLVNVPQGVARDPEVSFDGKKILFSMRRNKDEDYKIYEINADGSGLRQLTFTTGVTDIDPLYLPDGSIVFASTRDPKYCMCNIHIMANLYRMDGDGANINQIGRDTLHEGHPQLLPDGRIMYDRWEYVDRNFGNAQGLWTVNPDGTNHAIYWGNNTPSPDGVYDSRPIPGGDRVIAVMGACHDRPWGALGIIDRERGIDGPAPVVRTWPASAASLIRGEGADNFDTFKPLPIKYEDPYPLSDQFFLCSRMIGDGEKMGLYLIDTFGNEVLVHYEDPGCFDPIPLKATTPPPMIPSRRNFKDETGTFYITDVYQGTHLKGVQRGAVKWLRVVQEPEKRFWTVPAWSGQGVQRPAMNWHDFNNKQILGTVPVEADGSVAFKVPAGKFVYFQLLDQDGMMIQSMRSGTTLQPGETTGCIGCHDNRLSAPSAARSGTLTAWTKTPQTLEKWHGMDRPLNYRTDVQPVFDQHCVSCHDFGKPAGAKLNLAGDRDLVFSASYNELWRKGYTGAIGAGPAPVQEAYTWGSHASRLIKVLRGGHYDVKLDPESFDRLVTWIDLNAPYYPDYASAYPDNLAGRSPLNDAQVNRLTALTGVKFFELAAFQNNQGPKISFARPELSPCLSGLKERAPAQYDEALAIIKAGAAMLAQKPDAEMDGFTACPLDQQRQAKVKTMQQLEQRNRDAIIQGQKNYEGSAAADQVANLYCSTSKDGECVR